jgi:hypothetical protein
MAKKKVSKPKIVKPETKKLKDFLMFGVKPIR